MSDEDRLLSDLGELAREGEELRPLDAAERAAIADAVLARLAAGPPGEEAPVADTAPPPGSPATDTPALPAGAPANDAAPRAGAEKIVPLRPPARRPRALVWLAFAAALAAGVWLLVRSPAPQALSSYSIHTSGGDATHLGDAPQGEIRLAPGSRVTFRIEPDAPVDGALAVEAFLVDGGRARPWDAPLLRRAGGALLMEGTREALFEGVADGRWEVVFFVARPESMPARAALAAIAEGGAEGAGGLQVLRARVWLVPGKGSRAGGGPPRVELAGCAAAGAACERRPGRPLVVWTDAGEPGDVTIEAGDRAVSAAPVAVQGGLRFEVSIDEPEVDLRVTVRRDDRGTPLLVRVRAPAPHPGLDEAIAAARRGDAATAERLLGEVEQSAEPAIRLQALRQRARLALRRGDPAAGPLLRRAIDEARALDRAADGAEDRFALAHHLLFGARRIDEARAVLGGATVPGPAGAEVEVGRAYYLGLAAMEVGDLRAALASLRAAERGAERLSLEDQRGAALDVISEALATLGRPAESIIAAEQARALVPAGAHPCERARGASNFGWALLRAGGAADRRDHALREAAEIARAGCPSELGHVLTNVAVAEHASGRPAEARRALQAAREASPSPDPRDAVWWRATEGRIALSEGRAAEARAAFESLAALGESAVLPEAVFEGQLGRADALFALGDERGAREAYREAGAALAAWALAVPLGEGREAFLSAHGRAAHAELRALVAWAESAESAGDPRAGGLRREAAEAARRTASRAVRALADVSAAERLPAGARAAWSEAVGRYRAQRAVLEEKAAWTERGGARRSEVAAARDGLRKELDQAWALLRAPAGAGPASPGAGSPAAAAPAPTPPPEYGEIHLAIASLGTSWIALATTPETTHMQPLGAVPAGETAGGLAARLAAPLRDALLRAARVRVVSDGPGSGLDFQRMVLGDTPLLASHTVVYGLDAGPPAAAEPAAGRVAVVVVDPARDAPAVRATGAAAEAALGRRGFSVERVEGEAATHAALVAALERPEVALFFYAGHAVFEGLDGALSGLRLAGGARFTVSDILALGRVPRQIVLLACEGGRTATGSATGLGIAQAFLLRGAESAVAAPRPVEDAMAARLGAALAGELGAGKGAPEALAAAQAALYREAPAELDRQDGWAAFRAWVR